MDISKWALSRLIPGAALTFQEITKELSVGRGDKSFILNELGNFLTSLSKNELHAALSEAPRVPSDFYYANYLAAMVELASNRAGLAAPSWTREIAPLENPQFGSNLPSLRLHLLCNAIPAFRRRNIFVDSSVGGAI